MFYVDKKELPNEGKVDMAHARIVACHGLTPPTRVENMPPYINK